MWKITCHLWPLALLVAVPALASEQDREAQRKLLATGDELPVSAWIRELKALSLAYRPKNPIDRDDEEPKFIERVSKSLDNKVPKVTGKVKSFEWKNGTGYVKVDVAGVSKADRLSVGFNAPFAIVIDKETARKFPKGQSFELRAVTEFKPRYAGFAASKTSQHIATSLAS
jgi:hypothetical protein